MLPWSLKLLYKSIVFIDSFEKCASHILKFYFVAQSYLMQYLFLNLFHRSVQASEMPKKKILRAKLILKQTNQHVCVQNSVALMLIGFVGKMVLHTTMIVNYSLLNVRQMARLPRPIMVHVDI